MRVFPVVANVFQLSILYTASCFVVVLVTTVCARCNDCHPINVSHRGV